MEAITPKSDLQKSLDTINAIKVKVDAIGSQCKLIKIKDDLTLAIAQQNLAKANEMAKFVEDKRVEIKAPYLAAGKTVDEAAKTIVKELNEGIYHLKSEVKTWEQAKQKEAKDKQDAIDVALAQQKELLASQPLTPAVIDKFSELQTLAAQEKENLALESASNKTRGIRYTWKFELKDITKVPVEWLTIDESKVKEWMKENKDSLKEETKNGIKFYKEMIVTA